MTLRVLDERDVLDAVTPDRAIDAVLDALRGSARPAADPPRSRVPASHGVLLLMPAEVGRDLGVKVIGLASRAAPGVPSIQGAYLHLDAQTFAPIAVLDGAALTLVRTPAVSFAGVRSRLIATAEHRVVVFGTGPQARAHLGAFRTMARCGDRIARAAMVSRTGGGAIDGVPVLSQGSAEVADALAEATLVVCATGSPTPLFDADAVAADAVVIAVGSHEPDARELPAALLRGATVVVEDRATALREAGDVVLAIAEGAIGADELVELGDIARGRAVPATGRIVVKTTGMSWEDVVVARAILVAEGTPG